eukprot:1716461-Amphidinium_carterae.2
MPHEPAGVHIGGTTQTRRCKWERLLELVHALGRRRPESMRQPPGLCRRDAEFQHLCSCACRPVEHRSEFSDELG